MEARLLHPDQATASAARVSLRDSNLMRSVNTNLRQRSEGLADDEAIAFFCECDSASCYSPIWLSATSFDARMTSEPGWLLHQGHAPSAIWHRRAPLPTRTSLRAKPSTEAAKPRRIWTPSHRSAEQPDLRLTA